SPSYVSRIIKTHLNQSFASIVHNKKLENACRYLSASDLPVEQVIEIVGYSDVSHFYKIFKQKYGLSPRQYRTQSNKLGAGRHSAFP
ncbi:MAG: helix-turn-helix transcriptional regulator, partial [Massilioclostridium sp.]|nr:helix-turn-helix transcriptional regulator [Massilioclostridium sp.]